MPVHLYEEVQFDDTTPASGKATTEKDRRKALTTEDIGKKQAAHILRKHW